MKSAWTDHELAVVKDKWLIGWTDNEIATHLENRTAKSVQSKRLELKLVAQFYPERLHRRGRCAAPTQYSHDDEVDIMHRFYAQEPMATIAASYRVSVRAIESKIDCLRERGLTPRPPPMIERECLGCGNKFASILPKSINRRCSGCHAALIAGGSSFLTTY